MYRRLLAFDIILSKCKSQLHGSDWKVTPNNFRHGLRSIETRGAGKALVDLPLRSISHVFLKFSCIRLADVHATIDRTSSAAKLPLLASDFTGILNVKSSAYFTSKFWFGRMALISLTIIENSIGPKTVPWGTPQGTYTTNLKIKNEVKFV